MWIGGSGGVFEDVLFLETRGRENLSETGLKMGPQTAFNDSYMNPE